eukprot:363882-Chlamydomonas_euryale.AAC.8
MGRCGHGKRQSPPREQRPAIVSQPRSRDRASHACRANACTGMRCLLTPALIREEKDKVGSIGLDSFALRPPCMVCPGNVQLSPQAPLIRWLQASTRLRCQTGSSLLITQATLPLVIDAAGGQLLPQIIDAAGSQNGKRDGRGSTGGSGVRGDNTSDDWGPPELVLGVQKDVVWARCHLPKLTRVYSRDALIACVVRGKLDLPRPLFVAG